MEGQIALFLFRFGKLKHEINNSPRKLTWLGKERPDLLELCADLETAHRDIAHVLATKSAKHVFVTTPFENEWKEYERDYREIVHEAAKPVYARRFQTAAVYLKELGFQIGEWTMDSGKSEEEYWGEQYESFHAALQSIVFNPTTDDPAALMEASRGLVAEVHDAFSESEEEDNTLCVMSKNCNYYCYIANEDEDGYYQKVLGAWEFFEKTLGLDLSAIYKRWRSVPEVFIQPHVAQLENNPVVELYSEAVRAYVFGGKIASMAMCRALMEHILKKHYNVEGKDLENVIAMAEIKYPQLKNFKMQEKRKMTNVMLHDYESGSDVEDRALIEYFRTIKGMIQKIPERKR
jgi:hypothetical protein